MNFGVYIHFPYCEKKCPYCDFNSHVVNLIDHKKLLDAYKKDLDFYISKRKNTGNLISIFFGGGTPSLMEPFVVSEIIEYVCQKFYTKKENLEITLEANPSSFEVRKFQDFKKAGVNRISIGVQSFVEDDLKKLGRLHNAAQAIDAISEARNLFEKFSFDLIYARENHNIEDWKKELNFALKEFSPTHISLYSLTIEKGTEFFKLFQDGKLTIPPNQDEFYDVTNNICDTFGLQRYEVSNYATKGFECLHNILYWSGCEYFGIGPGAHGRIETNEGRIATMNFNSPEKYLQSIEEKGDAVQIYEILDDEKKAWEIISVCLRSVLGFQVNENIRNFLNFDKIKVLQNEGFLMYENNFIKPTTKGISVCDGIAKFIFI